MKLFKLALLALITTQTAFAAGDCTIGVHYKENDKPFFSRRNQISTTTRTNNFNSCTKNAFKTLDAWTKKLMNKGEIAQVSATYTVKADEMDTSTFLALRPKDAKEYRGPKDCRFSAIKDKSTSGIIVSSMLGGAGLYEKRAIPATSTEACIQNSLLKYKNIVAGGTPLIRSSTDFYDVTRNLEVDFQFFTSVVDSYDVSSIMREEFLNN